MEGVTILAVNEAVEASGFNWVAAIIVFLAATFIGFMCGVAEDTFGLDIILGVALGLTLGFLTGCITSQPAQPETYKVTISDTVNFNEFNERYKIINQEGLIYTIMEKNNEN